MAVHRALEIAAEAASAAWTRAIELHNRESLLEPVALGADGTETTRLDQLVEDAILLAVNPLRLNILSEEFGYLDMGSDETLVIDPVDGTGNAASGIPVSAFTGAIVRGDQFVEALTLWLATGQRWWAQVGQPGTRRTSGRTSPKGALISLIRPKEDPRAFLAVARQSSRVRILGCTSIEAALVADGAFDASLDPGSRTHRIVDLAAAVVLVEAAGGVVLDVHGRPVVFTRDVSERWSGVVAATPELGYALIDIVQTASAKIRPIESLSR